MSRKSWCFHVFIWHGPHWVQDLIQQIQTGTLGIWTQLMHYNMALFSNRLQRSSAVSRWEIFFPVFCPSGQMMEHMPQSVRRQSSVCESSWGKRRKDGEGVSDFVPHWVSSETAHLCENIIRCCVCVCAFGGLVVYQANKISLPSAVLWIPFGPSLCPVFLPAPST